MSKLPYSCIACLCMACFCTPCTQLQFPVASVTVSCLDRGAPLPSIAQWISGLFGSVDLAPSDITAALVLAAAAQRRRRRNRIKRALNPIIKAASNAPSYQTSDHLSETTASADDRECVHACQFSLLQIEELHRSLRLFVVCSAPMCDSSLASKNSHHSIP